MLDVSHIDFVIYPTGSQAYHTFLGQSHSHSSSQESIKPIPVPACNDLLLPTAYPFDVRVSVLPT